MSIPIMPPNGNSGNILGNSNGSLGDDRTPYKPNQVTSSLHTDRASSERQEAENAPVVVNGQDGSQLPSALPNGHAQTSASNGGPAYPRRSLAIMKREEERLKTFRRWHVPFMDPKKLAEAGFYYTNREDMVRCAFCGIELGCWEEGDDVQADHQRWSPLCPFLRQLPVGNMPLAGPPQEEDPSGYDTCGLYGIQVRPFSVPERAKVNSILAELSLEKLGVTRSHGPAFPSYCTYEARLASFENWPVSLKQRPDKLSEAGFYYTGKGDQTVCFHCGGGLKDWEENDDPWREHALWFSKCYFVLQVKGREFVAEVCSKKEPLLTTQEFRELRKAQTQQQSASTASEVASPAPSPSTSEGTPQEATPQEARKAASDALLCKICFTEEMGVVFLPCGHVVACLKCAAALSTCVLCRKPVSATVRAFLS
ncbi:baculoviral IAP repeat-containing protein 7-B-like [Bacillus rossius redtenbacheri]|uniref:baculoviral IAP repeat-containing protein 7-B-like n=1 Tax=Bacillus rossius redtenbacheri TaxID=93214 RepID=UPI002FDD17CE